MRFDVSWISSKSLYRCLIFGLLFLLYHLYQSSYPAKETSYQPFANRTVFKYTSKMRKISKNLETKKRNITIFAGTKYFGGTINTKEFMARCVDKHKYCQITSNPDDFSSVDAVVFHNRDYRLDQISSKVWNDRKPEIPYILWGQESPSNEEFRPMGNVINWTMTYRKDADVYAPYGRIEKLEKPIEIDLESIWKMKTKNISWLVSNCETPNKRFEIVKKIINTGFDVDIWGDCGKQVPKCPRNMHTSPCVAELIKPYKFYISMENSNCKDYVTEKFWRSLNSDRMTVPIVLVRKIYQDLGIPDSAYIALDDFPTIQDLVDHLKKVNSDKNLYLSYHKWRRNWRVIKDDGFHEFCSLCDILQNKEEIKRTSKVYWDVAKWNSFEVCDNTLANKFLSFFDYFPNFLISSFV